jgi:hypothetical protein
MCIGGLNLQFCSFHELYSHLRPSSLNTRATMRHPLPPAFRLLFNLSHFHSLVEMLTRFSLGSDTSSFLLQGENQAQAHCQSLIEMLTRLFWALTLAFLLQGESQAEARGGGARARAGAREGAHSVWKGVAGGQEDRGSAGEEKVGH